MKDCKGKELNIGDYVAFVRGKNSNASIDTGCITRFYKSNYGKDECSVGSNSHILSNRIMKLELEEKSQKGFLIELPCKIGDTVYFISSECDIYECEDYDDYCYRGCKKRQNLCIKNMVVNQFRIRDRNIAITDCDTIASTYEHSFSLNEFGKKVFLTREEAEEKLEKLKKNGVTNLDEYAKFLNGF